MHLSTPSFSYAITRPVPWRFYTPAITVTGLVLVVLLSFLNYAVNGFYLDVYQISNPNATQLEAWPHGGLLSSFAKAKGNCQPKNLEANTRFYTNNYGFSYLIIGIHSVQGNETSVASSITYLNNPLGNCTLQNMTTEFDSNDLVATYPNGSLSTWEFDTAVGHYLEQTNEPFEMLTWDTGTHHLLRHE